MMNSLCPQILVVDDEWTIRQQLARALASVGIDCECALDGDDALERYIHNRHELVVTDLRMPERHGHSLAVTLLEQPKPPKVVALTGITEPRLAKDLIARGVSDVVHKPVNYFQLAERLKKILEPRPIQDGQEGFAGTVEAPNNGGEGPEATELSPLSLRESLEMLFMQSPLPHRWLVMTLLWLDWKLLPNPSEAIRNTLLQISSRAMSGHESRRCEGRVTLNRRAVALQLSDDYEPAGFPFKVALRDLSQHGVGLIHSEPLKEQLIAISWKGRQEDRVVIVARVLRCRQVGEAYDIGATIEEFQLDERGQTIP